LGFPNQEDAAQRATAGGSVTIDLPYSLIIEARDEPDFFGFFSQDLQGFSGIGHSVADCLCRAKWAMREHLEMLAEQQLPIPARTSEPIVLIRNERKDAA